MENQTTLSMLVLSGLSQNVTIQHTLFLFFLFIYLLTLTGNLLILFLSCTNVELHTPMYFFLGTLACLDMSCSSVTTPRMLYDLITGRRTISLSDCMAQVFFLTFFITCEVFLFAAMSYDRYLAICRPLHYRQIMLWKICIEIVLAMFVFALVYALIHTLSALRLTFCGTNIVESFFCDLPQLLELSCTDTFINILLIFLFGLIAVLVNLVVTVYPYIRIISTLLKIKSKNMRHKAFSTCSSHLTVVSLFYGTACFNYFLTTTSHYFDEYKLASVFYTMLTPLLNPLIYSLRNQDLKSALRRTLKSLTVKN